MGRMDVLPWHHRVVGSKLRDTREQKRLTAKNFCAQHKISRQYLDDVEKGRRQPSRMWLYNVADYLGVDWQTLCEPLEDDDQAGAA